MNDEGAVEKWQEDPADDMLEWELYTELLSRQSTALNRLRDLALEADHLRKENSLLRKANEDLKRQLITRLLMGSGSSSTTPPLSCESPTSVIDDETSTINGAHQQHGLMMMGAADHHHHLPNSISVRSNGFLKMMDRTSSRSNSSSGGVGLSKPPMQNPNDQFLINPPPKSPDISKNGPNSQQQQQQRLTYLQKIDHEEGDSMSAEARMMELEAYRQGTYKTELCNKWQQTGACPYGSHCQFAHGVSELRPVIRHPRYKTEVCRMVLNGHKCPYGHRCHFRHSISHAS